MPVGKDSIRKRVILAEDEVSAETEPKANITDATPRAKRPGRPKKAPVAPIVASEPAADTQVVETPAPEPVAPAEDSPTTTVMGNVSPEVVEKVIGHPEQSDTRHVQITDDMPNYLL